MQPVAPRVAPALATGQPHSIGTHIAPINHIFTDDTGRFTAQARSGNQYIMMALHSETNAILVQPFQSKNDAHCIMAYKTMFNRLKS